MYVFKAAMWMCLRGCKVLSSVTLKIQMCPFQVLCGRVGAFNVTMALPSGNLVNYQVLKEQ